jgi:SSS family solute:Na+ symporter
VIVSLGLFVGFIAYYWKRPDKLDNMQEWGLGGSRFGVVVMWFLLGGDLYTAYTVIAVPGLASSSGALAMYAITYGIMIYPIVYAVMPRLYTISKKRHYITASDYIKDRFDSRFLALIIGLTGVLAELPYIALQITGIKYVLTELTLPVDLVLIIAFILVAFFTFITGLRGPALTSIVKDALIWLAMLTVLIYAAIHFGGYGNIFHQASLIFGKTASGANAPLFESPSIAVGYTTLALGSALALFLYPHAITATLGSKDVKTIKRNSAILPVYNILLLLVAILGITAVVAQGHVFSSATSSEAIPILISDIFPSWFTAFSYAAIVIASIVPASIMALASASILTRNVYVEYINPNASSKTQTNLTKVLVLVVIFASLAFSLVPAASGNIIYLQTFGGAFLLETLPAVYISLYTRKFNKYSVGIGWLVGLSLTLYTLYELRFASSLYKGFDFMYVGIAGLLLNLGVMFLIQFIFYLTGNRKDYGNIENSDLVPEE